MIKRGFESKLYELSDTSAGAMCYEKYLSLCNTSDENLNKNKDEFKDYINENVELCIDELYVLDNKAQYKNHNVMNNLQAKIQDFEEIFNAYYEL